MAAYADDVVKMYNPEKSISSQSTQRSQRKDEKLRIINGSTKKVNNFFVVPTIFFANFASGLRE
jgi:hypothetical protein